jgi:hypothetical protein
MIVQRVDQVTWLTAFNISRVVLVDFVRHFLQEFDTRNRDVLTYVFVASTGTLYSFEVRWQSVSGCYEAGCYCYC